MKEPLDSVHAAFSFFGVSFVAKAVENLLESEGGRSVDSCAYYLSKDRGVFRESAFCLRMPPKDEAFVVGETYVVYLNAFDRYYHVCHVRRTKPDGWRPEDDGLCRKDRVVDPLDYIEFNTREGVVVWLHRPVTPPTLPGPRPLMTFYVEKDGLVREYVSYSRESYPEEDDEDGDEEEDEDTTWWVVRTASDSYRVVASEFDEKPDMGEDDTVFGPFSSESEAYEERRWLKDHVPVDGGDEKAK